MRDLALGAVAGMLFGAAVVPLLLYVFKQTQRVLVSRLGDKRRDWAFVMAGALAMIIATGGLVLVVLLEPLTRDWSMFLSAYAPCFVLGLVLDNRIRKRSLR